MIGRTRTYNPNGEVADKYVGREVSLNGSDRTAKVLAAYWQGPGKPVELKLSELGSEAFIGNTEQWTLTRD